MVAMEIVIISYCGLGEISPITSPDTISLVITLNSITKNYLQETLVPRL